MNPDTASAPTRLDAIEQALHTAVTQHQAGQLEGAEKLYRAILKIDSKHPQSNYNLGALLVQQKQPAAGLTYLSAALDADPSCGKYWVSYIDALFEADQLEGARQVLELARQHGLQGDEVETLALRLESGALPGVKYNVEDSKSKNKSPQEINEDSQLNPGTPKSNSGKQRKSSGKSASHKSQAPSTHEEHSLVELFKQGRFNEAATVARDLTERFPLHSGGWKALGAALQNMDLYAESLLPMEKAALISPGDFEALNNLAITLQNLDRLDEAEANYRRALQINPNYANAQYNLGTVLQGMNRIGEAENCFRHALRINPNYAEAHGNLGVILKEKGLLAESENSYLKALKIQPDFTEAHNNLGATLVELGRMEEAETSYRRALKTNPNYAVAHNNLGAALVAMGRLDEAESCYRRALEIKPDYAEVYCNLGHLLCDLDETGRAAIAYQNAMNIKLDKTGLDAAVYLAILHYLGGDLEKCRSVLCASQSIITRSDNSLSSARNYWRYLDKLLDYQQQHLQNNIQLPGEKTLYVIGESHSLSAHGVEISYHDQKMRCAAEWIAGCKQCHLGNAKNNKYKHKYEAILSRLPRESTILLAIGEIDCRNDEGILQVWKKHPGKELTEITQATIAAYLNYVSQAGSRYGHRIIIEGVPATNFPLHTLTPIVAQQLVHLIRTFNATLSELALDAGMGYLDVYALTDRGDGIADGQWHIDDHHLLPSSIVQAFEKFSH